MRRLFILALVFLQGCIFVPRTETYYDQECQTYSRQMTLEPAVIGQFGHCGGRECGYVLVAIGAVAAASLIVSGSIVVVNNTVHWVEKQGKCSALL